MQGKTVLITGADRGIGRETTKGIAKKGAIIIMACIDLHDAKPVCEDIKEETGNPNIALMQVDLSSLHSIREFAAQFSKRYQQLNVLINNAGVYCTKRGETQEGFEKTMGINYLGPFLLTHLLLPILKQTPKARIVNVSSNAYFQGKIDLNNLHLKKGYQGFKAYSASKLAIVLSTLELAEQLKDTGVMVNALHPGHVATDIWNMWPGTWYQELLFKIVRRFAKSPEEAASTSIYVACSDELEGITGTYFDNKRPKALSPKCNDVHVRKGLWVLSKKLTGLV